MVEEGLKRWMTSRKVKKQKRDVDKSVLFPLAEKGEERESNKL